MMRLESIRRIEEKIALREENLDFDVDSLVSLQLIEEGKVKDNNYSKII